MSKRNTIRSIVTGLILFGLSARSMLAQEAKPVWEPIECVPADRSTAELYRAVQPVDDFDGKQLKWAAAVGGQHAKATLRRDTSERHQGDASLRVDYDFIGKKDYEYIQLNGAAAFAQPGLGFGFWFKHDGAPFSLRLRFIDTSGECHQVELLSSSQAGWQFVAGSLDSDSTAWGGDGNRRKDYPCKLAGICFDRPHVGFKGSGSLWIDDASIVHLSPAAPRPLKVELQNRRFGSLYVVGDVVALRASGEGDRIRWRLTDFFDNELAKGEGGAEARGLIQHGDAYAATYRRPNGSDLLVLWTGSESRRVTLSGAVEAGCDLMGRSIAPARFNVASENPIYLVGRNLAVKLNP